MQVVGIHIEDSEEAGGHWSPRGSALLLYLLHTPLASLMTESRV